MHFHISYLLFIVFLKVSSQMKGSIKGKQQTTVSSENTGPDREQCGQSIPRMAVMGAQQVPAGVRRHLNVTCSKLKSSLILHPTYVPEGAL